MSPKTFTGASVPTLLAEAQTVLGPDAVILHVRRIELHGGRPGFEVMASEPRSVTAESPYDARASRGSAAPQAAGVGASGRMVIAVVGPTGAGKTTTVAKLAVHPGVFQGRRVGLLCLDTYRIGAVEQLQTYAEIARLPFEVAYDPADLDTVLRRLAACSVILVDTPGQGSRSRRNFDALGDLLERIAPTETHLVLPVGTQSSVVRRTAAAFRGKGVTHLLATKVDESPDDNTIFDLAAELRLPMRWITDGQEVPSDLRSARERRGAAEQRVGIRENATAGVA